MITNHIPSALFLHKSSECHSLLGELPTLQWKKPRIECQQQNGNIFLKSPLESFVAYNIYSDVCHSTNLTLEADDIKNVWVFL